MAFPWSLAQALRLHGPIPSVPAGIAGLLPPFIQSPSLRPAPFRLRSLRSLLLAPSSPERPRLPGAGLRCGERSGRQSRPLQRALLRRLSFASQPVTPDCASRPDSAASSAIELKSFAAGFQVRSSPVRSLQLAPPTPDSLRPAPKRPPLRERGNVDRVRRLRPSR